MLTTEQQYAIQQVKDAIAQRKISDEAAGFSTHLFLEEHIDTLLKIITELSSLLDQMPASFTGKSYTVKEGTTMNQVALQIIDIAKGLGAKITEIKTLLGIARAESNFDFSAIGDKGYSHGAFQAERQPGYTPEHQVQTAYNRIHEQMGYLKPIYNELSPFVLNDDLEVGKYHKAAWQMAPTSLIHWMDNVRTRINMIKQNHGVEAIPSTGPTYPDGDILRILTGPGYGKLGINDLISFAGAHGVNAAVLKSGQRDFVAFMTTQLSQYADATGENNQQSAV